MSISRRRLLSSSITLPAAALGLGTSSSARADDDGDLGNRFYTSTNSAGDNEVVAYRYKRRGTKASLAEVQRVATGGQGSGSGLGSQGALAFNADRTALFVVNAGSNSLAMLRAGSGGLALITTVSSGGANPTSVTEFDNIVYVLNANSPNITGFVVDGAVLQPLPGSTQTLPAGSAPAQVSFTPDGTALVVSLRATNELLVFPVDEQGIAGAAVASPSAGQTPFGFAFTGSGILVVSEAFGGAPNASTVSTYSIRDDGTLAVITAALALLQSAACWVALSPGSRYAYTTNTGSGSLSAVRLRHQGAATLVPGSNGPAIAASPGAPIDAATRGLAMAVLSGGASSGPNRRLDLFDIKLRTGDLAHVASSGGLPASAAGLA